MVTGGILRWVPLRFRYVIHAYGGFHAQKRTRTQRW